MKKPISILLILAIFASLAVQVYPAQALTQIVGYTSHVGSSTYPTYNQVVGLNLTTTVPAGTWYVKQIIAYMINVTHVSGDSAKALLINTTQNIVDTSAATYGCTGGGNTWITFDMNYAQLEDYYVIAVISDENVTLCQSGGSDKFLDASNSYSTPVDPTDGATTAANCPEIYAVIVTEIPEATATPGPFPTGGSYQSTDTDTLINTFTGYLIPLILFLLPALILGWVTHWQKWPILIGLGIGSGLTYLFLGTQYLWLVVMTIIGIASMSYSDFRSNG